VTTPEPEGTGIGTLTALLKALATLPPEQLEALLEATTQARREAN